MSSRGPQARGVVEVRRVAGAATCALIAASVAVLRPAYADDDFGTDDPAQQVVVYTFTVTSVIGTLVTGVAAAVFAVRGKAYTTPWLVAALFSGALTLGTGVSLLTFDDSVSPPIGAVLVALSAWPLGYSVRSALNPEGFGQPLSLRTAPPGARVSIPLVTLEF